MPVFLRVLFLIAFVFLSVHSLRLVYERWLQPTESVLDQFDSDVDSQIRQASTLSELEASYRVARAEAAARRIEMKQEGVEESGRSDETSLVAESELRHAIESWEAQAFEIFRVRLYWFAGLLFLVAGLLAHRYSGRWLAIACYVVAFSEMIFWSSPPYFGARSLEVERLLGNKLSLALVSMVLLMLLARSLGILRRSSDRAGWVGTGLDLR